MMLAEFCSCDISSRVNGKSITVSMPFLPRMEGRESAIFSKPYSPVRMDDRGIIFLLSLAIDSTI